MLKDVTLGQFFPGSTPIHKLDPRTKLVLVIVYIVALFLAKWFVSYVVVAAFLAMVIAMSRIRLKVVLKNLKPLLFIILLSDCQFHIEMCSCHSFNDFHIKLTAIHSNFAAIQCYSIPHARYIFTIKTHI